MSVLESSLLHHSGDRGSMKATLWQVGTTVARYALELLRNSLSARCHAVRIGGTEKHSGAYLSALYLGSGRNFEFLLNRLFTGADVAETKSVTSALSGLALCRRAPANADLVIIDLDLPYSLLYSRSAQLQVPQWVKQKLILPPSKETFLASLPRKLRREIARCTRKYGYSYDLIATAQGFKSFYDEFYAPFIRSRFNSESVIVDERFFLSQCRRGVLLRLLCAGQPVAGAVLQLGRVQLSSLWVGFSTSEAAQGGSGASDVLDYFTIEHAFDTGCRTVDFGPTRPLLDDGVFRYKRKWGTSVHTSKLPTGDIQFRLIRFSTAVTSVMENNFWITRQRGKLTGHLFVDGQTLDEQVLQEIASNRAVGIDAITVKSLCGFNPSITRAVEGWQGLCLVDLSKSTNPMHDRSVV